MSNGSRRAPVQRRAVHPARLPRLALLTLAACLVLLTSANHASAVTFAAKPFSDNRPGPSIRDVVVRGVRRSRLAEHLQRDQLERLARPRRRRPRTSNLNPFGRNYLGIYARDGFQFTSAPSAAVSPAAIMVAARGLNGGTGGNYWKVSGWLGNWNAGGGTGGQPAVVSYGDPVYERRRLSCIRCRAASPGHHHPAVTVPPGSGISPRVTGIEVHRAPLRDTDWSWSDVGALKLPVPTPARTIVDLLLDNQEFSYVVRATHEALTEGLMTPAELVDTARDRKSRAGVLQTRTASLLKQAAA